MKRPRNPAPLLSFFALTGCAPESALVLQARPELTVSPAPLVLQRAEEGCEESVLTLTGEGALTGL